ncbi:hypothetical protein FXO38_19027 [Capsicum annuum]|nr:hypothetical protein FXO38_19027 [Capsicum annuum]
MDTTSGGNNPPESTHTTNEIDGNKEIDVLKKASYASLFKDKVKDNVVSKVFPKQVVILNGEPSMTWKSSEIRDLIIQENLQFAIVGGAALDEDDLEDTIDKVGIKGNLSPKQIQMLKAKQGIQRKKSVGVKARREVEWSSSTVAETEDIRKSISGCNVEDPEFKESKYTWWNGRTDEECIFKRLDKILINEKLHEVFPVPEVEQLTRSCSDHTPLKLNFSTVKKNITKPFRYELPKFVTYTNLVLLPKKLVVNTFSDLRPISLSNFVSKIFSRILHDRIKKVLPDVISEEQSAIQRMFAQFFWSSHIREKVNIGEAILSWWSEEVKGRLRTYHQSIPRMIIWELWKRRNSLKHKRKNVSTHKVIFNITRNMGLLLRVRNPRQIFPNSWPEMLKVLEGRKPQIKITKVLWKFPDFGWVIYNTNGESRGNPSVSSYAFYVRDHKGDLVYVERFKMKDTSNVEAEAKAILQAANHVHATHTGQLIIQSDSLLMHKIIIKHVMDDVDQIWKLM